MELGSEYNLHLSDLQFRSDNIFEYLKNHKRCLFFDSGRSALRHLCSFLKKEDEVLLPEFICESVISCFCQESIRFYRINDDFGIDIDDLRSKFTERTKAVFLMQYFGATASEDTLECIRDIVRNTDCIVIEDSTHCIFSRSSSIGDYQICSLRKWLQIPQGGVLYSDSDPLDIFDKADYKKSTCNDRAYGMILKDLYLREVMDCNAEYRRIFETCEKQMDDNEDICFISEFAAFLATCIDVRELMDRRKNNYRFLKNMLSDIGIKPAIRLSDDDCPLVLPIGTANRDEMRSYLIHKKIYCAVHWPFDGFKASERPFARECARSLLSLPIDQRYGEEEMKYLGEILREFGETV